MAIVSTLADHSPLTLAVGGAAVLLLVLLALHFPDRPLGVRARQQGIPVAPGTYPFVGTWGFVSRGLAGTLEGILYVVLDLQRSLAPGGKPYSFCIPLTLGGRTVVLNRPEYIEHIQKTNFDNYPKGEIQGSTMSDLLSPEGIFVADGNVWKQQRKLASRIFSVSNFREHVQTTVHSSINRLESLAADCIQTGTIVNLPDLMFRFTLDSFLEMAFAAPQGCLPSDHAGLDKQVPFAQAFDWAQGVVMKRFLNPLWKWTELVTSTGKGMREAIKTMNGTCFQIIDQRFEAIARGDANLSKSKGTGKDLLQLFIDHGCDRNMLVAVCLNFIIAGRDTTAQALGWAFYMLHKNPRVVARLRQEVANVLGPPEAQRPMDYDDLRDMPYTQAVFNETLRLWPSVPKNAKFVVQDDVVIPSSTFKEGYGTGAKPTEPGELPNVYVQKGTTVLWSDWAMGRMPEIWGEDCLDFKPERFLKEDGTLRAFSPFVFHAFNAGPRLCLGQTLATYEGCAVLASLLGKFHVRLFDDELAESPPDFGESLTLPIKNQYRAQFAIRE